MEQLAKGSNNLHTGETIRTFNGHYVNVFDPDPATIDIDDIAHALSMVCRFAGHTYRHYSVAQHSILVSRLVPDKMQLQALLHDATEAYMCDMPRPIKRHMKEYKSIEDNFMKVIAQKFNLPWPLSTEVKEADRHMLEVEHEFIILKRDSKQFPLWSPEKSELLFLGQFKLLTA